MRANRVDKILVTTGTEKADVGSLAVGDYVVLVDGEAANTPIEESSVFRVAVKKKNGVVKYSDSIKAKDIKSVTLAEYAPVVEQTAVVTLGTPTEGQEYLLTIIDRADKEILQFRQDKRSYQLIASAGETDATLAAKFVSLINDDQAAHVTATAAGGVITLTAKATSGNEQADGQFDVQHYFEVQLSEVNIYGLYVKFGTITYTAPDFGSGTFAKVRTIEQTTLGYEGILNRRLFPIPSFNYDTSVGDTYDLIVIEYDNNYWSNSVVAGKVDSPITLVIAVTAGNTASLETILANYL